MGPKLAPIFKETFPWIKLIGLMREPISRSISKFVMWEDKFQEGCLEFHTLTYCLRREREPYFGKIGALILLKYIYAI